MKKTLLLGIALLLCMLSYGYGCIDEDYIGIYDLKIPVIEVTTEDSVSPTFEVSISPYEGTTPYGLTNNDYVKGRMLIRTQDSVVYDSGDSIGSMKIKIRGNTSAITPSQKPYKIKLNKKADLMACIDGDVAGEDKEWLLLCANMMTPFGFKVSELVGLEWVPDYRFVNVVLNGDYRGFYLLVENVKRSENRCNISKEGFIIENDAYWWNEDIYFRTVCNGRTQDLGYTFKYPEIDSLNDPYLLKVEQYMNEVENVLNKNVNIPNYIDLSSFAKWKLVHDLMGTGDPWGSNMFLFKDRIEEGTLKMGPAWDFDGSYITKSDWALIHSNTCFYFVNKLNLYAPFNEAYKSEYENVRMQMLEAVSTMEEKYDDMQEDYDISISYSRKRHSVGRRYFDQEISVADEWFSSRIAWMDSAVQTLDVMDAMDVMLIEVAQVAQSNVYWVSLLGVDDSNQTGSSGV